jgi:hypothetical protein
MTPREYSNMITETKQGGRNMIQLNSPRVHKKNLKKMNTIHFAEDDRQTDLEFTLNKISHRRETIDKKSSYKETDELDEIHDLQFLIE